MKKIVSFLVLIMIFSLVTIAYSATNGFKDVKAGAWYYEYVTKASESGYVDGYTDGTFRPNANVTRAQLAKILVEYDNKSAVKLLNASEDEQIIINSVANAIPSTVRIKSDEGYGSGFFVKSNIVITNAHVVGNSATVTIVTSTGESLVGTILAKDKPKDIALVKVNKNFTPLKFSTSLQVGQNAISIGNPLGMDQTVTKGIVSKLEVLDYKVASMFQMDASINIGNSGGAVINSKGQVIGMTTGKLLDDIGSPAEGIGFALYASELQRFLNQHSK